MQEKMFRTLSIQKWWTDCDVIVEWWLRDGDTIKIATETIPFREYKDLAYLHREIRLNNIQKYIDE